MVSRFEKPQSGQINTDSKTTAAGMVVNRFKIKKTSSKAGALISGIWTSLRSPLGAGASNKVYLVYTPPRLPVFLQVEKSRFAVLQHSEASERERGMLRLLRTTINGKFCDTG
jgi:hypothetical protein